MHNETGYVVLGILSKQSLRSQIQQWTASRSAAAYEQDLVLVVFPLSAFQGVQGLVSPNVEVASDGVGLGSGLGRGRQRPRLPPSCVVVW